MHITDVCYAHHWRMLCTSLVYVMHITDVRYAHHWCTLCTSLMYVMHITGVCYAHHWCTLCTSLVYVMHITDVCYAHHWCMLCTSLMYVMHITGVCCAAGWQVHCCFSLPNFVKTWWKVNFPAEANGWSLSQQILACSMWCRYNMQQTTELHLQCFFCVSVIRLRCYVKFAGRYWFLCDLQHFCHKNPHPYTWGILLVKVVFFCSLLKICLNFVISDWVIMDWEFCRRLCRWYQQRRFRSCYAGVGFKSKISQAQCPWSASVISWIHGNVACILVVCK